MVHSLQRLAVDHRIGSACDGFRPFEGCAGTAPIAATAPRAAPRRPRPSDRPPMASRRTRTQPAARCDRGSARRPRTSTHAHAHPLSPPLDRAPRSPWPCPWPVLPGAGFASRHRETHGLAGARSAIACPSSARRQPGRLPPQLWTPGGSREPRRGRLAPAPGRTGHGHGPPGATTKQQRRGREGQPRRGRQGQQRRGCEGQSRRGCEEQPRRGAREAAGGPQRRASAAAARPPRGPA